MASRRAATKAGPVEPVLRICDFNSAYSPEGGGIRQYHERKLAFLADRGDVSYALIVPGAADSRSLVGSARRYTLRGPRIPGTPKYRFISRLAPLRRIVQEERPHILEVGAPYLAPWLARAAVRGLDTRLVGFWHADYPSSYVALALAPLGTWPAHLGEALAWRYARATFGRFDATFAASHHIVETLQSHGISPVYRTPLGVDTDLFHPRLRKKPPPAWVGTPRPVVYAGRLAPEKGVDVLLQAHLRVVAQRPGTRLVLAGDGPLLARLQRLQQSHPGIEWLGYLGTREQMAELMANAAVVVTPGGNETFSLTTLEALACGTPVVCADRGAAAELVRQTDAGRTFADGQPDDLAAALLDVLAWPADLRRRISQRARVRVDTHYRWSTVLEHLLSCYRQVLGW
jgi:alpha-1,6-mannosyltransferase